MLDALNANNIYKKKFWILLEIAFDSNYTLNVLENYNDFF